MVPRAHTKCSALALSGVLFGRMGRFCHVMETLTRCGAPDPGNGLALPQPPVDRPPFVACFITVDIAQSNRTKRMCPACDPDLPQPTAPPFGRHGKGHTYGPVLPRARMSRSWKIRTFVFATAILLPRLLACLRNRSENTGLRML